MIEEFKEIATTLYNPYAMKWKEGGRKIIAYGGIQVPGEVIHAAGMLPFRLRGTGATSTLISDQYFGPVICSFPKCILQLAGEGKYGFLDGVVITTECDHMRRLYDCWRVAEQDYLGILPSYFHYYAMLHKMSEYGVKWVTEETRILADSIAKHFGVEITDEKLSDAIRIFNEYRTLSQKLDELRKGDPVPISGAEATAVAVAGTAMPKEEFNRLLRALIEQLEKSKDGITGRKRLLLAGSASDDLDLVGLMEEAGAVVVADSLCFGSRCYADLVDEEGDPLAAIARRYLSHSLCPRMYGEYDSRLGFIKDRVEEWKVDGVVLQNIRFCDMHGCDNGIMEPDLEAIGIPTLRLEREYGPLIETGRVQMRLDAFLERLSR